MSFLKDWSDAIDRVIEMGANSGLKFEADNVLSNYKRVYLLEILELGRNKGCTTVGEAIETALDHSNLKVLMQEDALKIIKKVKSIYKESPLQDNDCIHRSIELLKDSKYKKVDDVS